MKTRRQFLRTGVVAAAASILPKIEAREAAADFHFVVVTDLHYRDRRCAEWFEKVVKQIRGTRPRPAFVVLAGDLAEDGTREQLGAIWGVFCPLPVPGGAVIGD